MKKTSFVIGLIIVSAFLLLSSTKAYAGLLDGSRKQSGSVNNNFFSENILKGENVVNGYTSFPETYRNYLESVNIKWEKTTQFAGSQYGLIEDNVGATLVGRFTFPRQYIFGDYTKPLSKNLILGADIGGAPNRNDLSINAKELYSDNTEFDVKVTEEESYSIKTPRANGSTSSKWGVIADYQSYKITVTRLKKAINTRIPNMQLNFEWRTNPAYGDTFGTYWYDNYLFTATKNFYIFSKKSDPVIEVTTKDITRLVGQEKVGEVVYKPEDFIDNVKINGTVYDNSYFNFYFAKKPGTMIDYPDYINFSCVGKQPVYLRVEQKSDEKKDVYTQSNIVTKWGNTIGTNNVIYKDATGFSLSLLNGNDDKPHIVSTLGNGLNSNNWINDYYSNKDYVKVKIYQNSKYSLGMNDAIPYINFGMKGNQTISDASARWNELSNLTNLSYGDVIECNVPLSDGQGNTKDNNWVMRNENQNFESFGKESVYYEITNNGFITLHFNHLDASKSFEIYTSDTKETLAKKLQNKEFLTNENFQSVELVKFTKYPDNSKAGITKGNIQVQEKLNNGNYAIYEYEVAFTVKDDLKISANPNKQTLYLGSDSSNISPYSLVTDVKLGNKTLAKDDYTVSVQNTVSTDTVGDKNSKVLITYKKDTSKTLTLDVPVKVLWGNTIGSNNVIYQTSTGFSLSLLTEDKPNIVATLGNGANSGNWINDFRNGTYITTKVYKDSQLINSENANPYISLEISGRENVNTATNKWNGLSNRNTISYGDVLQYDVLTEWGDNNWVMRDEKQKFESLGKQSIYYEITKNGYRTLHLNHLETKNVTIPIYSTEEYLDKNIKDYIDLKGYSNISVKEFSQYPNTKASGQQKGKIIVEETLTTGKKVQYEYEVTFTIGEGTLTYSVPKTLTFKEFTKSKSEQIIQRMYSGNLGLEISDSRGKGKQGNWRLTAQVKKSEELAPYLIFRDGTSQDKYLNQGATEVCSQAKQSNPTEPLNVEVSGQWTKDTGILLRVPANNTLSNKQYASTITWNLVEGP